MKYKHQQLIKIPKSKACIVHRVEGAATLSLSCFIFCWYHFLVCKKRTASRSPHMHAQFLLNYNHQDV